MVRAAERIGEGAVQGVVPLGESGVRWQRRAVLAITIIPFVGSIAALLSLWGWGVGVSDLVIALPLYAFTGIGVTVGFHRLLTHRSFRSPRPVRYLFAVAGSMAIQGSVIDWVADHRRHHAYSDREGDPHSPHLDAGDGFVGILRGLWHAHVGWMFRRDRTERGRWAPDLLADPGMRVIDRSFPALVVFSFALPAVLGYALSGSAAGAVTAFLWGGLARVFFLHHVTWSINSICHFYGTRPFVTPDHSTNNWPLALVSFGESWHNNHHAFPTSAIHGLGRWQIDPSGIVIRALQKVGLARSVRMPTEDQLKKKSRAEDVSLLRS